MMPLDVMPRVCAKCGKPFETTAYRYVENGIPKRDYFHSGCFRKFKETLK